MSLLQKASRLAALVGVCGLLGAQPAVAAPPPRNTVAQQQFVNLLNKPTTPRFVVGFAPPVTVPATTKATSKMTTPTTTKPATTTTTSALTTTTTPTITTLSTTRSAALPGLPPASIFQP